MKLTKKQKKDFTTNFIFAFAMIIISSGILTIGLLSGATFLGVSSIFLGLTAYGLSIVLWVALFGSVAIKRLKPKKQSDKTITNERE